MKQVRMMLRYRLGFVDGPSESDSLRRRLLELDLAVAALTESCTPLSGTVYHVGLSIHVGF